MSKLTIRPLNTGWTHVDKGLYLTYHRNVGQKVDIPVGAFLIEGGDQLVLVDTGMADTERANKYHHPGDHQEPGQAIHENLAAIGIKPEDIDLVIFTHLHWDHTSNMKRFINARFVAHRREYEFALNPIPLYYKSYEHPILGIERPFEGVKFELVDGEEEIVPGIRVFPTPGHSPGHQAVIVETAKGEYILAGDAVFIWENLEPIPELHYPFTPPGRFACLLDAWRSMEEIIRRAKGKEFILPTHEIAIFEKTIYP